MVRLAAEVTLCISERPDYLATAQDVIMRRRIKKKWRNGGGNNLITYRIGLLQL